MLSAKPHDRRALIEEAAGIGRFKAKRHQAELKLEATRQNLARLDDLIPFARRHGLKIGTIADLIAYLLLFVLLALRAPWMTTRSAS